jgi:hypothetical protein
MTAGFLQALIFDGRQCILPMWQTEKSKNSIALF